jgi:hypothetical protein
MQTNSKQITPIIKMQALPTYIFFPPRTPHPPKKKALVRARTHTHTHTHTHTGP